MEEVIKWISIKEYPVDQKYHPTLLITNGTTVHEAVYDPNIHVSKPKPFFRMPGVRDSDCRFYSPTHYCPIPKPFRG